MATAGSKPGIFYRMYRFTRESWLELCRTSWPSSDELKKSTLLVLAAILVVAIWIGGLDYLLAITTKRLLNW
ncbi:MAG TPA: preprotein translocase subunit SecE [Armatimonadota bacterium]|nr:preprotein translocase subunit SecE [Armatimonadota bacterium]